MIRKALVPLIAAIVFLTATPAQATEYGTVCTNFEHGVGADHQKIRVCVAVNIHDFTGAKESVLDIDVLDSPSYGFLWINRDYLRLYKGATVVKTNNWDSSICFDASGGCAYVDHYHASTDWFTPCSGSQDSNFYASFRFQIKWYSEGYGNWKNISSNLVTTCS